MNESIRDRLQKWTQRGEDEPSVLFSALDIHFAGYAMDFARCDLDRDSQNTAALLFALCHYRYREGHILLDTNILPELLSGPDSVPTSAEVNRLYIKLKESPSHDDPDNPIHWECPETLYIRRMWQAEISVANRVIERLTQPKSYQSDASDCMDRFQWPDSITPVQAKAAQAPLENRLTLISGGPGTGKTYTIFQTCRLLQTSQKHVTIHLMAPTGKAVARMQESIREGLKKEFHEAGLIHLNVQTSTIHRFLNQYTSRRSGLSAFPHPIEPPDVVIIDEASMVDLSLFHKVLEALPPESRLVLMGDRHQLSSVQPGSVFSDLFEGCHENPALPQDGIIELTDAFRFKGSPELSQLCNAIQSESTQRAINHLKNATPESPITFVDTSQPDEIDALLKKWSLEHLGCAAIESNPEVALQLFSQAMILCVQNEGPYGVNTLNRNIGKWIASQVAKPSTQVAMWEPILIRENDRSTGLYNGDIGIRRFMGGSALDAPVLATGSAYFFSLEGELEIRSSASLPANSPAYALTVHKSQGSEAAHVLLLMPDRVNAVLSRELIYTAVSRAKKTLTLVGPESTIRYCLEHPTRRDSRMKERLQQCLTSHRFDNRNGST
jgi:exodeoxyribonuclease V alpha subunit